LLETINLENIVEIESSNVLSRNPILLTANLAAATTIGDYAFVGPDEDNASGLTSISIPVAETIGTGAFYGVNITNIDIPASVISIGDQAFREAMLLTDVGVHWTSAETIPEITAIGDGVGVFFGLTPVNINLYVPVNTLSFYAAKVGWQDLNIIEGDLPALSVGDNMEQELGFSVYPNPATDVVTVTGAGLDNAELSIYDITGALLSTSTASGATTTVDVSNLVSGMYILKIKSGNSVYVQQIVKK
jgi:hypothetical protein